MKIGYRTQTYMSTEIFTLDLYSIHIKDQYCPKSKNYVKLNIHSTQSREKYSETKNIGTNKPTK